MALAQGYGLCHAILLHVLVLLLSNSTSDDSGKLFVSRTYPLMRVQRTVLSFARATAEERAKHEIANAAGIVSHCYGAAREDLEGLDVLGKRESVSRQLSREALRIEPGRS